MQPSFLACIDEFLDSLFTVGEYKPESRSRTFKFTEIRRKKYSKICHNVRKFRLCRQISTSKKNSKKKLKKHFGYISTSSNRFGRKISKIHRYSRERTLANFANFHQHFVIFHDKIKQKHKLKPNVDQNYAR